MPIYEFQCRDCGASFEHLSPAMATRDDAEACPKCHSRRTTRKISVFAVGAVQSPLTGDVEPGMCACGKVKGACGGMN